MGSEKTKVIILAVVFLLLLGAVGALVFMNMNKKSTEEASGPTPPAPVAVAANTAQAPQLLPPTMPTPVQLTVPIKAVEKDPLGGGNYTRRVNVKPPPPPSEVKVFELPPISPEKNKLRRGGWKMGGGSSGTPGTPGTLGANERAKPAPLGRHAGWVYNTNGQIWAIFEDSDGAARAVRVGDEIGGYTIKAIAQDYVVLADGDGQEQKIKLQGLDTFQGKTRNVTIDANPGAAGGAPGGAGVPAWGAP